MRNPAATGEEVGSHALVSAGYAGSEHWRVYGGDPYLFSGEYLRQSGYLTALRTSYLLFSFSLSKRGCVDQIGLSYSGRPARHLVRGVYSTWQR